MNFCTAAFELENQHFVVTQLELQQQTSFRCFDNELV